MSDTFQVRCVRRPARLDLLPGHARSFSASLIEEELSARVDVAQIGGGDGLDSYWASLAEEWRGWTGSKVWKSHEQDLELAATSDGKGHISLKVTLNRGSASASGWQAQTTLVIEAGQLDRIASDALAFCRLLGAAA
ncbi:MAG: DUF6228 family protein [Candidatus Acidiferrales bacterium]